MKKNWLAPALLGLSALLTWVLAPSAPSGGTAAKSSRLPFRIGTWEGRDQAVDDRTYALLGTRDVLLREYAAPGRPPVGLCVVFSTEDRKVSHPPEVCYQGDGYDILEKGKRDLGPGGAALRANHLRVERRGRGLEVLYWYKVGRAYTDNFYRQQWRALWRRDKGGGYALIRLSVPTDGADGAPLRTLEDFSRELLPLLEDTLEG